MTDRFEQFTSSVFSIYQCIQKIQRQEMARYGLKSAHVQCLLTLQRWPEGITAVRLGQLCERDKAAISRTLAELEKDGLVERVEKNGSSYRALLRLTQSGQEAAGKVEGRTELAVEKAGEGLTDEDRRTLYAVLERIADNLQTICRDGLETQTNTTIV